MMCAFECSFINRLRWSVLADTIGQTQHKITYPKNTSVCSSSAVTIHNSNVETILPRQILLFTQHCWTLKDILTLIQVNCAFYHFFSALSLLHNFKQYHSLKLQYASVLQWHCIYSNWYRYAGLSKLSNFIPWKFRAQGNPFDKLPTDNVYLYQGYYFMMNNTDKLRVIVFNWDKSQGTHIGEYDNGWLETLKLRQRMDLLVIDKTPLTSYPYYIKTNIIMFDNSHCYLNTIVNSIITNDSLVIIFQKCILYDQNMQCDPMRQSLKNKSKKRSIVFSHMYQWIQMWRMCVRNSAIFDYNFQNILYQGNWDVAIQEKTLPIKFIVLLTDICKPYWNDDNQPYFSMLFTSQPDCKCLAKKIQYCNCLSNKLQYSKLFFATLTTQYEKIIKGMKYYKAFIVGICHIRVDGEKCAFVFNLKNTIDKKQIKQYQKKWMDVLQGNLNLEKDDFERESKYMKNLCQM